MGWCANAVPLAEIDRLRAELAEWRKLKDPAVLHLNLLRGNVLTLSREQMLHLLGDEAQDIDALRAEVADLRDACAEKQRCIDSSVTAQRAFLAEIDALRAELAEARKPDCRLCMNIMGCQVTAPPAITCRDGSEYFAAAPLRLYEKESIATESAATATRLWGGDAHEM